MQTWITARAVRVVSLLAAVTIGLGATKGPDAGGYSATDSTVYSLVDISGPSGGASVLSGTDDGVVALTIPFPLYGIFRYLYLVHQKKGGGSPSTMLLTDKPLLLCVGLWVCAVVLIIYRPLLP